jgi:nucleoside-diphosphate-sugar epimerase
VTFGTRNFANMYSLIRQVHSGLFVFMGPCTNVKGLTYIENILAATLYLLGRDDLPAFDVYNCVDKPDLNSRQIAGEIFRALGREPTRRRIPLWVGLLAALPFDVVIKLTGRNLAISGERIRKLFQVETRFESDKLRAAGFQAPVPLPEGIKRMVDWYVQSGRHESSEWHLPPDEPVKFLKAPASPA